MGTRRTGGDSGISRASRKGTRYVRALKRELQENVGARIAVNTAIGYAAASNPAVGSVVAAYKVGKFGYTVVQAYDKTKRRTGSVARAKQAALRAARKEVGKEVRS